MVIIWLDSTVCASPLGTSQHCCLSPIWDPCGLFPVPSHNIYCILMHWGWVSIKLPAWLLKPCWTVHFLVAVDLHSLSKLIFCSCTVPPLGRRSPVTRWLGPASWTGSLVWTVFAFNSSLLTLQNIHSVCSNAFKLSCCVPITDFWHSLASYFLIESVSCPLHDSMSIIL